jgi:hypothetical protein
LRQPQDNDDKQKPGSNYASAFATGMPFLRTSLRTSRVSTIPESNKEMSKQQQQQQQQPSPPPPHDFSPLIATRNDMAEELKTPQRIEIEREDAIDILACLVE